MSVGTDFRVIIRALDQVGNKMRYINETISVNLSGPVILFGPNLIPFMAGSAGFWIRAIELGIIKNLNNEQPFSTKRNFNCCEINCSSVFI